MQQKIVYSRKNFTCFACSKQGAASYHKFPADPDIQEKWKEFCFQAGTMLRPEDSTKNLKICHDHFEKTDFVNAIAPGVQRQFTLKRGAIPTLFKDKQGVTMKIQINKTSETNCTPPCDVQSIERINDLATSQVHSGEPEIDDQLCSSLFLDNSAWENQYFNYPSPDYLKNIILAEYPDGEIGTPEEILADLNSLDDISIDLEQDQCQDIGIVNDINPENAARSYIGNYTNEDMSNPQRARSFRNLALSIINKKTKTIRTLRQQIRRLKAANVKLKSLTNP